MNGLRLADFADGDGTFEWLERLFFSHYPLSRFLSGIREGMKILYVYSINNTAIFSC